MNLNFNTPTPIEQYTFRDRTFLLKRDDLISQDFSGNKARKIDWYIDNLPKNLKTIVSYGSVQSNAMYSLAKFSNLLGLQFRYYANHIPSFLKDNPVGNYKLTLDLGADIIEGYNSLEVGENELYIKEGIATKEAFCGIEKLALELIEQLDGKEYQVFLPSGTGTTALFLAKALKVHGTDNIKVFTTPVVGSREYLLEQFRELEADKNYYPTIIDTKKRYHFGKLYREFYLLWLELQNEIGLEFDMLYDPKGWMALLEHIDKFDNLVYIHQGGILGNATMLERYKRKYDETFIFQKSS